MCVRKNTDQDGFTFTDLCLINSKEEEILRVTIDNKLSFNTHKKDL